MFKQKRKVMYMCVRVGFLDGVFIACKCYSSSKPMFCVNTFSDTFIVINMPCTVQLKLCWSSHLSASRCLCLHSEVVVLLLATLSCWRPQRKSPANVLPSPTSTCCPDDKNIPMAAFLQPCHSWVQWNWGGKKKREGKKNPIRTLERGKEKNQTWFLGLFWQRTDIKTKDGVILHLLCALFVGCLWHMIYH